VTTTAPPIDITRALATPGYMEPAELSWLATQASRSHLIAEIGSWQGRSTRAIADHTPGTVFAIDHFLGVPELLYELTDRPPYWLYKNFTMHLIDRDNVIPVRQSSRDAARLLATLSFDLIFIDGSHIYEDVKQDIRLWKPLVSPGGLLCGHDALEAVGVEHAVGELLPNAEIADGTDIWWIRL
jgi:predicted O-methyltransferase YrrM